MPEYFEMDEDKIKRNEVPLDVTAWWPSDGRPSDPYEALMRCAPHEEPSTSMAEMLGAREAIADAFELLTPEEMWVFNALVVEGMSLRKVGRQINCPKTTISRIRDRARKKLQDALADNPYVISVLKGLTNVRSTTIDS